MKSSKHRHPPPAGPSKSRRKLYKATLMCFTESLEARRLLSAVSLAGLDQSVNYDQNASGAALQQSTPALVAGATAFSNLSAAATLAQGTASVTFSGTITAGTLVPPSSETVAILLNGVTQNAAINSQGNFTATFNISALPAANAPYPVTYAYAGDGSFHPVTNNTTTTLLVMPRNGTEIPVYRLYSPITKEHLYTDDFNEYITLGTDGWNQEGIAYIEYNGLATIGNVTTEPIYRLYEPAIQQHLWTTDLNEDDTLATLGWTQEGVAGYVFPLAVATSEPLYRLNYPATPTNGDLHLWTTDANEYNALAAQDGWTQEGIVAYVVPPGPVAQIVVAPNGGTIQYGDSPLQLTATVKDKNGNPIVLPAGDSLAWTSSQPAVATVDSSGKVTALAPGGSVTITVTEKATGITSAPVAFTVYGQVTRILLTIADSQINVGDATYVVATAYDSVGHVLTLAPGRILFSSNNTSVATVDGNGNVIGQGIGSATLTASDATTGISGSASVMVTAPPYNDYYDYTDVPYGDYNDVPYSDYSDVPYADYTDVPYSDHSDVPYTDHSDVPYSDYSDVPYSDYSDAPYADYSDSSSEGTAVAEPALGSIAPAPAAPQAPQNKADVVTELATGICTGTPPIAMADAGSPNLGIAATAVAATVPEHLAIWPNSGAVNEGLRLQLTAVPLDQDNQLLPLAAGASLIWNSSNAAVATVGAATGLVSGIAPGTVQITLTDANHPGISAAATVTVAGVLDHIAVSPDGGSVNARQTLQLTATPQDKINNPVMLAVWDSLNWSSDNKAVATVDPATGLVTAVSAGTAHIMVADAEDPSVAKTVLVVVIAGLLRIAPIPNRDAAANGRKANSSNPASGPGVFGATPWH